MPLTPGTSREIVGRNISEMVRAGYPQRQAVAAALREASASARKHRASGGLTGGIPLGMGSVGRQALRGEEENSQGFLHGITPGRTDTIPLSPSAGSYVIPADVVSGLGEGTSLAGAAVLDRMFHSEPYGIRPEDARAHLGAPRPPAPYRESESSVRLARGGVDDGRVPIIAAAGEYLVPPEVVRRIGGGDIDRGHKILDRFVKEVRKRTIKTLKALPGPKK